MNDMTAEHLNREIDRLREAGDRLEQQLMQLHPNHHFRGCDRCDTLTHWWTTRGR